MNEPAVAPGDAPGDGWLDRLRCFDSPTLANAIETFDVRLRNEGFADGGIRAQFDDLPPVVGYAGDGAHPVVDAAAGRPPVPRPHRLVDRTS